MPENQDNEMKVKTKGIDFEAIELQIDQEIDCLFVPATQTRPEAEKSTQAENADLKRAAPAQTSAVRPSNGEPPKQVTEKLKPAPAMNELELEINQEIDKLFSTPEPAAVQVEQRPDLLVTHRIEEKDILLEPVIEPPPIEFAPEPAPAVEKKLDLNVDALDIQIDKEIDSLFVPTGSFHAGAEEAPRLDLKMETPAVERKNPVPVLPAAVPGPGPAQRAGLDLPDEMQTEVPLLLESVVIAEPEKVFPADSREDQELAPLIEAFNIAYLSLDWEFSIENISSLESALFNLEPYCRKNVGTNSIYKILAMMLERVKTKPHTINPQLIELVRDAQEALKTMLLKGGMLGAQEKEKVKTLIGRFQGTREKPAFERPVQASAPAAEALPPTVSGLEARSDARRDAAELSEWVKSSLAIGQDAVQGLDAENMRLRRIEDILGKSKALEPLTIRLADIRSNLERHISALKANQDGWDSRIDLLSGLEVPFEGGRAAEEHPVSLLETESEAPKADEGAVSPVGRAVEPDVRKEQVCFFAIGGRKFAVLGSQVVKIQKLSAKKAKNISKRGYAGLSDFKPLLKSIKADLFGTWGGLPADVLKGYVFLPVPPEVLGFTESPPKAGGAIMVSTGRKHALIFCDSAAVDLENEAGILLGKSNDGLTLGTIRSDDGSLVTVLNLDRIFNQIG